MKAVKLGNCVSPLCLVSSTLTQRVPTWKLEQDPVEPAVCGFSRKAGVASRRAAMPAVDPTLCTPRTSYFSSSFGSENLVDHTATMQT